MPNSSKTDGDISRLHPAIRDKVQAIQDQLHKEDIPFRVFEAFRTPERQQELAARRPKVTWVGPWRSIHQYGLAVDFVLFENGKWSWNDKGARAKWWTRMHVLAKENGLTPLYNKAGKLIEKPHIQLEGVKASELAKGHYPDGGDHVWTEHLTELIDNWNGPVAAPPKPPKIKLKPPIDEALVEGMEDGLVPTAQGQTIGNAADDPLFLKLHGFVERIEQIHGAGNSFGITADRLAAWRDTPASDADLVGLSSSEIRDLLRSHVYLRCRCPEMPQRMAMVVYNSALMSNPKRAVTTLQQAFNALGMTVKDGDNPEAPGVPLVEDGEIGPLTLAAAKQTDASVLSSAFIDAYTAYLQSLSHFAKHEDGWMLRLNHLREFLNTLPEGAGERPTTIMKVSGSRFDLGLDTDDLLRLAVLGATGGKSAVAKAVLGKALARKAKESVVQSHGKELLEELLEGRLGLDIDTETAEAEKKLTPVNAALGESLGKVLDGKKSVIGILGLVATVILPDLGVLSTGAEEWLVGKVGDVQAAASNGHQMTILTLLSIFTGWGFLGKIDKAIREVK